MSIHRYNATSGLGEALSQVRDARKAIDEEWKPGEALRCIAEARDELDRAENAIRAELEHDKREKRIRELGEKAYAEEQAALVKGKPPL